MFYGWLKRSNKTHVNLGDAVAPIGDSVSQMVHAVAHNPIRVGGCILNMNNRTVETFTLPAGATRYRLTCYLVSSSGGILAVGYSSPMDFSNASHLMLDTGELSDDVPAGTTVYVSLLSPMDRTVVAGGPDDLLQVNYYGVG